MTPDDSDQSQDEIPENYLAALDIGSNSFHFVLAREIDNHLQILHKEKYRVQLARGLDTDNVLNQEAIERGIDTLKLLSSTVAKLSNENFRAVATYTLRTAKNSDAFLKAAKKVFPFDLEVISGHEEARLIYQGVAHGISDPNPRLVVDIGGGSTECIVGEQLKINTLASLDMGCVNFASEFFANKRISKENFEQAITVAKQRIESIVKRFKKHGWQNVYGTSGTIKKAFLMSDLPLEEELTLTHLHKLAKVLYSDKADSLLAKINEPNLDTLCAGVSVLTAVFEMLDIKAMQFSDSALREGVLHENLDLIHNIDLRNQTVASAMERFSVEKTQAELIKEFASDLYHQCAPDMNIGKRLYKKLLNWACLLHEIGANINVSGYHKHGGYIISQADFAGFTQEQQSALAWLVSSQRKKPTPAENLEWRLLDPVKLNRLLAIIRLSVLLNRQRQLTDSPEIALSFKKDRLTLTYPRNWLKQRPLIKADLNDEKRYQELLGLKLILES